MLTHEIHKTIGWAISVPRLGFTDNHLCSSQITARYGIFPKQFCGAFWGQCLEGVMGEMLDGGCDWILTTDYDTVFKPADFEKLCELMDRMDDRADAIAAIQLRRKDHRVLMGMSREDAEQMPEVACENFKPDLTPCTVAHFGFTMFRVDALRRMPHPWFLNVPDKDGKWGEGKQDEDIYFWRKWQETGNTLYVANHVVVGHIESLITWPDANMQPIHQSASDFWSTGKPAHIWS